MILQGWLNTVAALVLAVTLVGAPCKNCQPKAREAAHHCDHPCCPKPKTDQRCAWLPADYDAVAKASAPAVDAPLAVAVESVAPEIVFAPVWRMDAPALDSSPPPVYLSLSTLRL